MKKKIFTFIISPVLLSLGIFQISNAMDKQSIQYQSVPVKSALEIAAEAQKDAEAAEVVAKEAMAAEFDSGSDKARRAAKLSEDAANKARRAANFAVDTADLAEGNKNIAALKAAESPKERKIFASAAEEEDDFYDNYDYQERYDWADSARRLTEQTAEYAAAARFFRTDAEKAALEALDESS